MGDRATVQIRQEFTRSRLGFQLILMQVHSQCADVWPILRGSVYPCRKRRSADLVTGRATYRLHLMLAHHQVYQRQIMYLPVFLDSPWDTLERLLTVLACCRTMTHHLVWRGGWEQGVAGVPHLPPDRFSLALRCLWRAMPSRKGG